MKNNEDSGLKHPHTSLKDHSVLAVRCGSETQSIQYAMQLNGGKDELKHKQSIEHDINISGMIKCKEELNSPNKNAENSRTKEQVL